MLASLVDGGPGLIPASPQAVPFPAPLPGPGTLTADAWAGRARRLAHPAGSLRTIRQGLAELGGAGPPSRLPRTSLNRPTGPRRRLDVITADLAAVRDLGHEHGGTVNDVILAAVTGALRALLASRGEQLEQVTVSVPVSARRHAASGRLGNQVGVMPVALPAAGSLAGRITRIAAITRQRKTAAKGTSVALLGPLFRLLAATGLLRWFVNRQRLVHTFATNLRGPAQPLTASPCRPSNRPGACWLRSARPSRLARSAACGWTFSIRRRGKRRLLLAVMRRVRSGRRRGDRGTRRSSGLRWGMRTSCARSRSTTGSARTGSSPSTGSAGPPRTC